jgi:putative sigma-54 modulation protein
MTRSTSNQEYVGEDIQATVTGRHVSVTESMKEHVLDKLAKLERFTNRIIDVHVTMDVVKLDHIVDIVIKFDHFKISTHAASEDMYRSIDKAVTKLERIVRKHKTRLQNHQAKGLSSIDMKVNVLRRDPLDELNDKIEEENLKEAEEAFRPHEIVSEETRPLKVLTNDEAVMKMDFSGDSFLIFLSEEDQKIKVIYRRKNDNYGIIDPN